MADNTINKKTDNITVQKPVVTSGGDNSLAFSKINYILLAIGMAVVILGFLLMSGGSTTTEAYNPEIFSPLRIKVAPLVCLFGFLFIVVAIIFHRQPRKTNDGC